MNAHVHYIISLIYYMQLYAYIRTASVAKCLSEFDYNAKNCLFMVTRKFLVYVEFLFYNLNNYMYLYNIYGDFFFIPIQLKYKTVEHLMNFQGIFFFLFKH